MDIFWIGVITGLAIAAVTVLVITFCLRLAEKSIPIRKLGKDVNPEDFQSGDILVTGRGTIPDAFKLGRWGHAAIVDREPNGKVYVIEVHRYTREKRNFLRMPWEEWIEYHPREDCVYLSLNSPISLDWRRYQEAKLDKIGLHWVKYACMRKKPVGDRYTCSGLVVQILQDHGVVAKTWNACSYSPTDLVERRIPLINGYSYSQPVRFVLP